MSETIKKLRSEFKTDFQQFAYRCLKIRTKTNGVVPFELNSVQLDLLDKFENAMRFDGRARFIALKARQMGLSTFIEALIYWWTIFHAGTKSLVLTHLDSATKELFEMTRRYHDNCPEAFKPPVALTVLPPVIGIFSKITTLVAPFCAASIAALIPAPPAPIIV